MANLHPLVEFVALGDQRAAVFHRLDQRLLAEHKLARIQRVHGDLEVRAQRAGNHHGVHVRVGQQFLVVIGHLRRFRCHRRLDLLLCRLGAHGQVLFRVGKANQIDRGVLIRLVHVGEGDNLDVRVVRQPLANVEGALAAHANTAHAHLAVLRIAEGRVARCDREARRSGGGTRDLHKVPSVDLVAHVHVRPFIPRFSGI